MTEPADLLWLLLSGSSCYIRPFPSSSSPPAGTAPSCAPVIFAPRRHQHIVVYYVQRQRVEHQLKRYWNSSLYSNFFLPNNDRCCSFETDGENRSDDKFLTRVQSQSFLPSVPTSPSVSSSSSRLNPSRPVCHLNASSQTDRPISESLKRNYQQINFSSFLISDWWAAGSLPKPLGVPAGNSCSPENQGFHPKRW